MTGERQAPGPLAAGPSPPDKRAGRVSWGWARWSWRTLTSMRTALILLALLALAAVPGSVFPQRNVASDPAAVERYIAENPTISPWLDRLGFFDVYASPWFAAIYLLLLVSMTGCVLPRCARLWRSVRAAPPSAPTNLTRLEPYQSWSTGEASAGVLERAAAQLRRRGFRVRVDDDQVRAEKGYVRELGNLSFHLSLLVLLVGMALGSLAGFEGRVAVAEGATFTNVPAEYDAFTPSVWTDVSNLEPFSFTLQDFEVSFETQGPEVGQPRSFSAALTYRTGRSGESQRIDVATNQPLDINETKAFLTGHGYAPVVTVRDGRGRTVFTGPVIFLPIDTSFASDGVVKAPGARPTQLGFQGFFLPTADIGEQGPYSAYPDTLNPRLFLTAFTGDLGLDDGTPQSVYTLDKSGLDQVTQDGEPFRRALAVGETMRLPNGQGSLTFDRVARFANFQIAHDPGKEISLVAGVMLLIGLTTSLAVPRRRLWLRVTPDKWDHTQQRVELAGLSLSRRSVPDSDARGLLRALGRNPDADAGTGTGTKESP